MNVPRSLASDPRRLRLMLVFAIHGATVGSFFSRIAELRLAMNLGEAALGVALAGLPAGVLVGSLLISGVIERFGTRKTMMAMVPLFAGGLVLSALAVGTASLFAALIVFGFGLVNVNVTQNVEADRLEAATGRRLINRGHGSWGIGFLVATLAATGVVAAGVPPLIHFVILFVVLSTAAFFIVAPLKASPARAHGGSVRPPGRLVLPTVGVLLVMGFAMSGIVLEGSTRAWSIIYLHDDFTVAAWTATLTLPSFVICQTIGRFAADPLIDRHGPARVAVALTVISALGLALVVLARSVPLVLVGFALVGLGISTAYPQSISAVARRGDRPASENVASFSTLATVVNFMTPPLFGFIAAHAGVRVSFAMLLVLPVIALVFAHFLEAERAAASAASG